MSRVKRQDVIERAEEINLIVQVRPIRGQSIQRYVFWNYDNKFLGTALGAKQAMIWLDGFEAGYKSGQEA